MLREFEVGVRLSDAFSRGGSETSGACNGNGYDKRAHAHLHLFALRMHCTRHAVK